MKADLFRYPVNTGNFMAQQNRRRQAGLLLLAALAHLRVPDFVGQARL